MSISEYARRCMLAKHWWQKAALFVQSLPLRHRIWRIERSMR